jgi:AcrR family transcriptional regulator
MTKHRSQDERRTQILQAARVCFIRRGYAETRVDDIAEEAGLSKGGIYFHFKSKRAILDALYADQQRQTRELLDLNLQLEGSPADQLRALATGLLQHFTRAEDQRKFLIVLAEMGIRDPVLMESVNAAHRNYVAALRNQMQAGIALGVFRDVDAHQTAMLLKLLIDGIEQGLALGYDIDVLPLLETGLTVILHGLVAPDARQDD